MPEPSVAEVASSALQTRSAGCTHTEHPNVRSGPYLFHEGQRLSFRGWDCAKDHSPCGGQCLTNSLYEGLTEELHLPNLIDDTHSLPWATAGTCLRMTKTVTGTAKAHAAQSPPHAPAAITPESTTLWKTHRLTVHRGQFTANSSPLGTVPPRKLNAPSRPVLAVCAPPEELQ